jgi:large repetitive protein
VGQARVELTILVGPPFVVTAAELPGMRQGQPYGPFQFQTAGSVGAVTWATTGGLPPGITVSPGGALSGTPTQEGPFTFTMTANDEG